MAGRKTKLTSELQTTICGYIRAGAYDWVAAQACGIHPRTFWRWLRAGEKGNPLYMAFCQEVARARTQARVIAENKVFQENPFAWLRYGPGRERPGEPGWTESMEVSGPGGDAIPLGITAIDYRLGLDALAPCLPGCPVPPAATVGASDHRLPGGGRR